MAYPYDDNVLARLRAGIGRVESGGNYEALGPEITRKRGIDRAYGKYQVMGANIPSWTEMALGQRMTPLEFLHNPHAQELVFEHQMRRNLEKYGTPENAASVWFSGRPLAQASREGARDVNMPVQQYVAKALGTPSFGSETVVAGGDDALMGRLARKKGKFFAPEVETTPQVPVMQQPVTPVRGFMQAPSKYIGAPSSVPQTVPKPTPQMQMPRSPVAPAPNPEDVWGFGMEAANALSFGKIRTPYSYLSGYSPEQINVARELYERSHPIKAGMAELAGGLGQGAILGGLTMGAAPVVAPLALGAKAAQVFPAIARGVSAAGRYLPGFVQSGIKGAGLGAGQSALNVDVHPEIPASEQIGMGAAVGGALGVPAAWLTKATKAVFNPELEPRLRTLGQEAADKYGIHLQPWQLASERAAQEVSSKMLTEPAAKKQLGELETAYSKLFKHSGDFHPDNIDASLNNIGDDIEKIVKTVRINPAARGVGRQFMRDAQDIRNELYRHVVDPNEQARIDRILSYIENEVTNPPFTGGAIQNLVQKNGTIDHNLPATSNSLYKYWNRRLKSLVLDTFELADPAKKAEFDEARKAYKAGIIASLAGTESGKLDPTKLAAAVDRVRPSGEAKDLGKIGKQMFSVSEQGMPNIPKAPESQNLFTEHPVLSTGLGGFGLAAAHHYGSELLKHLDYSAIPVALGGLGAGAPLAGAYAAYKYGVPSFLRSPYGQRLVMQGRGPEIQNVLYGTMPRGAVNALGESYQAERRRK